MVRYRFVEWRDETGAVVGAEPTLTLLIDRDKTLIAHYEEVPTYTLTIATTTGGTTDPSPGSYVYYEGETATVTAIPDAGYRFSHWILDGETRTENPINITMDRDYSLTAYFEVVPPTEYTLTINTTVGGTTDPTPGTYTYPEGTSVNVTAIPDSGYVFDHWVLDGATRTENPITVLMDSDHTLTAYFTTAPPVEYTLTISTTTGGTTDPAPGSYTHPEGTSVTVTAIPDSGYEFDHWVLDGATRTENPITVLMDSDHTLTAYFRLIPVEYTLTISTTTGGTTDPTPGSYTYLEGTVVTVTAIPESGYRLVRWELDGADVGNPLSISVTMDVDHTLHAVFEAIPPAMGVITGTVTDAETGEPITGAIVRANTYITTTESDGIYTLEVAAGTYTITFRKPGYEIYTTTVTVAEGETVTVDAALTPVWVPVWPFPIISRLAELFPLIASLIERLRRR